jgi:mRNA-degrading endonuclease toxin of MazEF toxin-antitoxin module
MTILNRGDIVSTRIPHASGNRGKKRPAVIIQADIYNAKVKHFLVAEITKNLAAASDPASFLIDISTPDGMATGLDQNSVVCCLFLATVSDTGITKVIGKLSDTMKAQLDACLKAAIQLP